MQLCEAKSFIFKTIEFEGYKSRIWFNYFELLTKHHQLWVIPPLKKWTVSFHQN